MRLHLFPLVAAAMLTGSVASGQVVSIAGLFSTGVDATGTPLAEGSIDPHYTILETAAGTARVISHPTLTCRGASTWYVPFQSCWIWENANGHPTNVTRTFRLSFDLTGLDHTTASISGQWGTDNSGRIFLNALNTGLTNSGFGTPTSFSISSGFVAGINTLDFEVTDVGVISGLNVQRLQGTAELLDTQVAVPEPGTYLLMATGLLALGAVRVRRRNA